MKNFRYTTAFNLLLILFFCVFIFFYEERTEQKLQQATDNHATILAPSVWTLFSPFMDKYLKLAVESSDYQQMIVTSQVDRELYSYRHQLTGLEALLLDLGIIRIAAFSAPIEYRAENIGQLKIYAYNKNSYLYGYLCIVVALISLLSWFVALLYRERKSLKIRVEEKTAELAENNRQLQNEIKERKIKEKELRESEQTFFALFDQSFQFIALLDLDCRVCKINKTALKFRQLKKEEIIGKRFWETPWLSHSEELVQQFKEAFTLAIKGQVARFEAYSAQVREIYLDVSLKPVFGENSEVVFIIAEARDITEVRHAENELKQAQKMESVGTLAGGIAHDFNNILAGILGTLNLLKLKREKGKPLTEEQLFKHLDNVTDTAMRAKDIVTQLLTLSRKKKLEFAPINLKKTLEHVCHIAQSSFDKSISINSNLAEEIPVNADANSLEQVFLNICINAAHAMTIMRPEGEAWGGTLSIASKQVVGQQQSDGTPDRFCWRISISDTGVGMDAKTREQIFIPFFTTKEKESGSGLGLAMVYSIIKQHKGFIEVESQQGNGSCFHVYLPVCEEEQLEQPDVPEPELVLGKGNILVIDDEELVRNSAVEILSECGYQVFAAENGRLGVERYQQQGKIDAVLLDLVMPIMSGKETYATLKELNPAVKVLLSSGFRHDSRVDEILAAGANDFIQKPYSLYKLSKAIKKVLDS